MGRFTKAVIKAKEAFLNAMTLSDETEHEKYIQIGVFDNGEVCVMRNMDETFLQDVVYNFALIRKFHSGPSGEMMMGIKVYSPDSVDFDIMPITELSTWQVIVNNGFADCLKSKKDNALRFVLMSRHQIKQEVFDFLYETYPETELKDIIWHCARLDAVKWAEAHGADRHYDGLINPMQDIMAYQNKLESDKIFQYLYGCTQEDHRKKLEEKRAAG